MTEKRTTCRIDGCTEPRYVQSSSALCHEHYLEYFRTIMAGRKESVSLQKRRAMLDHAFERLHVRELLDARANVKKAA